MKLTCKLLKEVLKPFKGTRGIEIYKSHEGNTGKPATRVNLFKVDKKTRVEIKQYCWKQGVFLYQDDPLHCPLDYVATF